MFYQLNDQIMTLTNDADICDAVETFIKDNVNDYDDSDVDDYIEIILHGKYLYECIRDSCNDKIAAYELYSKINSLVCKNIKYDILNTDEDTSCEHSVSPFELYRHHYNAYHNGDKTTTFMNDFYVYMCSTNIFDYHSPSKGFKQCKKEYVERSELETIEEYSMCKCFNSYDGERKCACKLRTDLCYEQYSSISQGSDRSIFIYDTINAWNVFSSVFGKIITYKHKDNSLIRSIQKMHSNKDNYSSKSDIWDNLNNSNKDEFKEEDTWRILFDMGNTIYE